jgi:hypothetical protein
MILSENLKTKVYHEDEVLGAETELNTLIDRVHEWFDTRIEQAEQKLKGAGFDPDQMQRVCKHYETRSVTGAVTQYLDILAKADLYLSLLQFLWVTGELSDSPDEALRVKLNTEREVRHTLHGFCRAASMHYNNIRRLCNGVVEKRRQERAAKALRAEERKKEKTKRREKRLAEEKQNLTAAQDEMDGLMVPAEMDSLVPAAS